MRQRPAAHQAVIDDLHAGRILWGPLYRVGTGEIREPDGTYVRPVGRPMLAALLEDGLIEAHPTVRHRYRLTERAWPDARRQPAPLSQEE